METLTNIIEAVLFASGNGVPVADIAEKLGVTSGQVKKALGALREKYGEEGGLQLLEFNGKAQIASNPAYKEQVAAVLNPIREKELTKTILECAAIIAYKQPITRTEIELIRGVNSDYAVNALLDLKLITPCGRKDAVGRPVLFATTDEFLKRFQLESLDDLPDYDTLMEKLVRKADERDSYLYAREEYQDGEDEKVRKPFPVPEAEDAEGAEEPRPLGSEYELPEFLREEEDLLKID